MSVSDNRISAVHKTGRHMLRTKARLAGWVEGRQLGLAPGQSDLIADAALAAVINVLETWEREGQTPPTVPVGGLDRHNTTPGEIK